MNPMDQEVFPHRTSEVIIELLDGISDGIEVEAIHDDSASIRTSLFSQPTVAGEKLPTRVAPR
jgi:hypothetical protein